jgi:oligoribonuclease NrnB/cAMP/cGMP phosphodiesterase (DHH superfamily)
MRLVTRADFDGLACGALITKIEKIDSYLFVEPKFMQDGMVDIRRDDIIANLPYHPQCSLWFDHHVTNTNSWRRYCGFTEPEHERPIVPGKGAFRLAPSAARVIYEYYTSESVLKNAESPVNRAEQLRFLKSERIRLLMEETDKIDAALLPPATSSFQ